MDPLVMAVASAALGGVLLGLSLGLWLGERSRRIGAERFLQYGQPGKPEATVVRPPKDAEERALSAGKVEFSEQTMQRAVAHVANLYREAGYSVPDDDQLRLEAEMLLNGEEPPV